MRREDTTSTLVITFKLPTEVFLDEMKVFRKKKSPLACLYIPHKNCDPNILKEISMSNSTTVNHWRIVMVFDFIPEINESWCELLSVVKINLLALKI